MANYCSNHITFIGPNSDKALSHFASLGNNAFPFLDIYVSEDYVLFESRWSPPIKELNQLAEKLSVSYKLDFDIPHEGRESYSYTCLQEETLEPPAEQVREFINRAQTETQPKGTERLVDDFLLNRTFSLRELGLFSCLLKKRLAEIHRKNDTSQTPWESNDLSTDRKRGR